MSSVPVIVVRVARAVDRVDSVDVIDVAVSVIIDTVRLYLTWIAPHVRGEVRMGIAYACIDYEREEGVAACSVVPGRW